MIAAAPDAVPFDWKNPDYLPVYRQRFVRLEHLRAHPLDLAAVKLFYRDHPVHFINDWGTLHEPRNPERGLPAFIPFVLFPRQVQFLEWVLERWRNGQSGLIEKSRDVGASYLLTSLSCTLCLFHNGITVGIGSRKEQLLDNAGDPSSLFFKVRTFLEHLPPEFGQQWTSAHMRILFPETQSAVVGEAGDQIGRGGRASLYLVDEAAYLERPELIEASLSATTNCRIDVSSVNGLANPFAQKRFSNKVPVFTMHWRDDPRKGDEWYARQVVTLDPVTVAQEIDIDYRGSVEGQLIPSAWVQAAIGAHLKLGIQPTGRMYAGFDVADEGKDKNCFAGRHGILLQHLHSWSGRDSDIFKSVVKVFSYCEEYGYTDGFFYDADGLGAGVRGDADVINAERRACGKREFRDQPFRGSGGVWKPDAQMVPKRYNKDFFANLKAQSWWALRLRFQATYRAVVEKMPHDPDDIISIDPKLPELLPLQMELSQPTYQVNTVGKIVVDKTPDGMASPNMADAVMIAYHPGFATHTLRVWHRLAQ